MKKTFLAILVAAICGTASAQVTVSGKLGKTLDRAELGSHNVTTMQTDPTSNLNITARENIGGIKVTAVMETSLSGNTFGGNDTQLGDRQATVGLSGKLGSIDFGRSVHSHFVNIASNDVFETLYGSIAGDVHPLYGLRISNTVFANFVPWKNTNIMMERTQNGSNEVSVYGVSTKFAGVNAMVTRYDQADTLSNVVSVATKVPMDINLYYVYSDNSGKLNHNGHLLGASKRSGNITYKVSWGKNENLDVKNAYAIGADYYFSKRTSVGIAYNDIQRNNHADRSNLGATITHRF